MVNIDLKTSGAQRSAYDSKTDSSLVVILIIALIIIGMAVGVYFWKTSLAKNIAVIDEGIEMETKDLSRQETKDVMDFQNRLKAADEVSSEKSSLLVSFEEIEKAIIPDVYIKSLSHDGESLEVTIVAKDFSSLAQQISSFKKSGGFSGEVGIGVAKVNTEQKVETVLTLKVN